MKYRTKKRMRRTLTSAGLALGVLLAVPLTSANAITIGQAAIDRATLDTADDGFVISLGSETFPNDPCCEKVTSWSTYLGTAGELGLLILRGDQTTATVIGSDVQTGVLGLNTFTPSSAIYVQPGDFLGIWMNDARVDLDILAGDNSSGPDSYALGFVGAAPTVGSSISLNGSVLNRNYSINAEYTIPEPGTLALFGLGLAGLGFARRKRASVTAA